MKKTSSFMQTLMMKCQLPFIIVLNKCLGITGKLTTNQRSVITLILAGLFSIFLFIVISRFNPINMQKKAIVFILGMIAIILVNVDKKLEVKPWNLSIIVPYYIVAILMIITSFTHNTGRGELEIIGFIMIFIFTPFYIVSGNKTGEEMERFFLLIAKGFCYTGLAYIVVLFLFFPQATQYVPDSGVAFYEYLGMNRNPNALGFVLCPIVACSLYLFVREKNKVIPLIVVALSLQLMLLSVARASQVSLIVMIAVMIICIAYYYKTSMNNLGKGILIGIVGAAFVFASQPLWEYLFNYAQIAHATTSEESVSLYDKLNKLSSGRMDVYLYYIEEITLFGTDASQGHVSEGGKAMYAHNNYLDIAFKSGIFAGVAYFIMIILSFIISVKYFFVSKGKECLLGIITIGGFLCYSMLETAIIPFHDGFMALVYIIMAGVTIKK